MSKRTVNSGLLKQAIDRYFGGDLGRFSEATGVSKSWLEKATSGNYHREPKALTIKAVVREARFSEDELFPFVGAKGKRRAS